MTTMLQILQLTGCLSRPVNITKGDSKIVFTLLVVIQHLMLRMYICEGAVESCAFKITTCKEYLPLRM